MEKASEFIEISTLGRGCSGFQCTLRVCVFAGCAAAGSLPIGECVGACGCRNAFLAHAPCGQERNQVVREQFTCIPPIGKRI